MQRLQPMGKVLFGVGLAILIARSLKVLTTLPGLPSFWYSNQAIWVGLALGLIAFGWQVLWNPLQLSSPGWRPSVDGRRFRTGVLYVAEGCHLCDDAAEMLKNYQRWLPVMKEIDIRSEQELTERFRTCVPVVELDGKVRFRGRIPEDLLRRLIEGTPPLAS